VRSMLFRYLFDYEQAEAPNRVVQAMEQGNYTPSDVRIAHPVSYSINSFLVYTVAVGKDLVSTMCRLQSTIFKSFDTIGMFEMFDNRKQK
jgi:hypothetical protein